MKDLSKKELTKIKKRIISLLLDEYSLEEATHDVNEATIENIEGTIMITYSNGKFDLLEYDSEGVLDWVK